MVSRVRLKSFAVLFLTFTLGVLLGLASLRLYTRYALGKHRPGGPGFFMQQHKLQMLSRRLELDAEQERQIKNVFEQSRPRRAALERELLDRCGAPVRAQQAEVDAQIRELLRPDQQASFDALVERRARRRPH